MLESKCYAGIHYTLLSVKSLPVKTPPQSPVFPNMSSLRQPLDLCAQTLKWRMDAEHNRTSPLSVLVPTVIKFSQDDVVKVLPICSILYWQHGSALGHS